MDNDYLHNIIGSPYVNEGSLSRLKAVSAQGLQNLRAMGGQGIESPQSTKIKSLWTGFYNSLHNIVKDWAEQGKPNIDTRAKTGITLTPEHKEVISMLNSLVDAVQHPITTQMGKNIYTPEKYLNRPIYRGGKYSTSLKGMVNESYWDAIKRQFTGGSKINKAMSSQDPGNIINAYKNKIVSLYNKFIEDAVKMLKIPKNSIIQIAKKINPKPKSTIGKTPYVPSGNIENVIDKIEQLESTPDIQVKPETTPGQLSPTPGNIPVQTPPTLSTQPKQTGIKNEPEGEINGEDDSEKIAAIDFPDIVLRTMEIVINAVESDVSHSEPFFVTQKLPTSYHQGLIIKEATDPNIPSTPTPKTVAKPEKAPLKPDEAEEVEGEFVYNLRGYLRKGNNFSIQVKPINKSLETLKLPSGGTYKIEVWWNNEDTINTLIALLIPSGGGNTTQASIMEFSDHQVSSYLGATPGSGSPNEFSVSKIVKQAHEFDEDDKLNPSDKSVLNAVTPTLNNIEKLQDKFWRSLWAVSYRKSMEWKPKKKGSESLTFNAATGDVTIIRKGAKVETIPQNEVKSLVNSTDKKLSEKWVNSLDHYGYFEYFPAIKPIDPEVGYPQFDDAILSLVALGFKESESKEYVKMGWQKLRLQDLNRDPKTFTTQELTKNALTSEEEVKAKAQQAQQPIPVATQPKIDPKTEPTFQPKPVEQPETKPVEPPKPKKDVPITKVELDATTGELQWIPDSGEIKSLDTHQVIGLMKKSPNFKKSLEKAGLLNKYIEAGKKEEELKNKLLTRKMKKKQNPTSEICNPFQKANFLLD